MYTPERMCAVCRKRLPKENLLRIAVNSDGVRVDFSGKLQGRGAYLCKDSACIDKCIKKKDVGTHPENGSTVTDL